MPVETILCNVRVNLYKKESDYYETARNMDTNGAWHKGKGVSSCIMEGMGRYRISTKNGIDSSGKNS
jgi:hypothetical protein